jgi:hypothetical protein
VSPAANTPSAPKTPLDVACEYVACGFAPIPVPYKKKNPGFEGWQNLRVTAENVEGFFSKRRLNIGVLLGEPSGGLVDVDLDCDEAVAVAPFFLPPTRTFGRSGRKKSHYLYRNALACPKLKLIDPTAPPPTSVGPTKRTTLVELRSTGQQTIFPGSVHISGEPIEWSDDDDDTEPVAVDPAKLARLVHLVGAASLLARHWPNGARQDTSLALAGALLREKWPVDETTRFLNAVAVAAQDDEVPKRLACVADTHDALTRGEPTTGWPKLAVLIGAPIVAKVTAWIGASGHAATTDDGDGTSGPAHRREKQADVLVHLAREHCTLFHDSADVSYARTKDGSVLRLRGTSFRALLGKLYFEAHASTAGSAAKADAMGTLEGLALHASTCERVFVRVGEHGGNLYLDLANKAHEVVEVTSSGWSIVSTCPIHFVHPKGMLPLARPEPGGAVEALEEFLNVTSTDDFVLIVSWLITALRPRGPYPLLALQGRHGSAKSTTSRVLRTLTDPNMAPIRTPPREPRDLSIAAQNAQVLAFDNLSGVPDWLSDALCRVATGGGFATRELYTDGEEKLFDATRPIILNGIDDLLARPDLADRALMVTLPEIGATKRRDEKSFWQAFDSAAPAILGALLDGVARALRDEPNITLPTMPRMADFVRWASAALPAFALPKSALLDAMARSKADATAVALEADPLAHAILGLLDDCDDTWSGTATKLLATIRDGLDRDAKWELPRASNVLTNRLNRLAPMLREVGVQVSVTRTSAERRIDLVRRDRGPSPSSSSSSNAKKHAEVDDDARAATVVPIVTPRGRDARNVDDDDAPPPDRHRARAPYPADDDGDGDDDVSASPVTLPRTKRGKRPRAREEAGAE